MPRTDPPAWNDRPSLTHALRAEDKTTNVRLFPTAG